MESYAPQNETDGLQLSVFRFAEHAPLPDIIDLPGAPEPFSAPGTHLLHKKTGGQMTSC